MVLREKQISGGVDGAMPGEQQSVPSLLLPEPSSQQLPKLHPLKINS